MTWTGAPVDVPSAPRIADLRFRQFRDEGDYEALGFRVTDRGTTYRKAW